MRVCVPLPATRSPRLFGTGRARPLIGRDVVAHCDGGLLEDFFFLLPARGGTAA